MKEYTSDHLFNALDDYKAALSQDVSADELTKLRENAASQLLFAAISDNLTGKDGKEWLPGKLGFFGLDKDQPLYDCYERLRLESQYLTASHHGEPIPAPLEAYNASQNAYSMAYFEAAKGKDDELSLLIYRADFAKKTAEMALSYEGGEEDIEAALREGRLGKDEPFVALYRTILAKMKNEALNSADTTINTPRTEGKGITGDQSPPMNRLDDEGAART